MSLSGPLGYGWCARDQLVVDAGSPPESGTITRVHNDHPSPRLRPSVERPPGRALDTRVAAADGGPADHIVGEDRVLQPRAGVEVPGPDMLEPGALFEVAAR